MRALGTCVFVLLVGTTLAARSGQFGVYPPSASFKTLFAEYRHGDAERAVAAFSEWTPERVRAEAILPISTTDSGSRAALALFHTEAGMRSRTFGTFDPNTKAVLNIGGWGIEKIFDVHSYAAYRLITDLARRARDTEDEALLSFCRSWYIASISYCMHWNHYYCVSELVDKGNHDLDAGDDPEYLLLRGSLVEPRRESAFGLADRPHVDWLEGEEARWLLKKALTHDPSLIEARVRIGHIYLVTGVFGDAETELRAALREAQAAHHLFATYLAAFFLGETLEETDRLAEAAQFYRIAVDAVPQAHGAALALSQALVRTGRATEGWLAARDMFNGEGPNREAVLDPYGIYYAAQYWQAGSRLRQMRGMVRQ